MKTTANDILAYKGDAAMGNAQNGVTQGGVIETKEMDQVMQQMAYLNMQKNRTIYQQKVKERDEVMDQLAKGTADIPGALPEDRAIMTQHLEAIKQKYYEHGGDIKSDPNVWLDFNSKLSKFQETTVYAKSRNKLITEGLEAASKETDPIKKQKMIAHFEAQRKKDLFQPVDPYQQALDFDWQIVGTKIDGKRTILKQDGVNITYRDKTDIADGYRKYTTLYKTGDKQGITNHVDTFLENFYGQNGIIDQASAMKQIELVNKRLKEIAVQEGLDPADESKLPEYLRPLKAGVINGKIQSGGYKWDDWYKIQLAYQYKNAEGTAYDEDAAKAAKNAADIDAIKAMAEQRRSAAAANRARANNTKAKTKAIEANYETPAEFYSEVGDKAYTGTRAFDGAAVTIMDEKDMSSGLKTALGDLRPTNKLGHYYLRPTQVIIPRKKADGTVVEEPLNEKEAESRYTFWRSKWKKDKEMQARFPAGTMLDFLTDFDAGYQIEVEGKDAKGKLTRSNRLSAYTIQRKEMGVKDTKSLMEEDGEIDIKE